MLTDRGIITRANRAMLRIPRKGKLTVFLQLLPATVWIGMGAGIPLITVVIFSFFTPSMWGYEPILTVENYHELFRPTVVKMLLGSLKATGIILAIALLSAYPAAYFLALKLRSERLKMTLLLLAIVPFWTSYLTRMVTFIPLLGRTGVLNSFFMRIGLTDHPFTSLIFSEPSIWIVEAYIWVVFVIGPIYFSLSMIDRRLIDAAKTLGARSWEISVHIIFPLSLPGIAAACLFIIVLSMGEFATPTIIGGGQYPNLAMGLMTELEAVHWTTGSAMAVLLTAITMGAVILLLRIVDLRKHLS